MAEVQQPVLIYDRIDANRRKTLLLLVLFALVLLPVAAYVAQYLMMWVGLFTFGVGGLLSGDDWERGLIVAAAISVGIVLAAAYLEYRYAAALVLRLAGARPVGRDQEPDLLRTVENLCIGAGLPQPKVYIIESAAPNAFATGFEPGQASLAVTHGLLALLDRRELEGVIAHELSHIGNYDTRLNTVVAAGVTMLRLPALIATGFFRFLFQLHLVVGLAALLYLVLMLCLILTVLGSDLASDSSILPSSLLLFSMIFPFYVLFGAPLLGELIRGAVSREREFLADADAALLTRYPEGLARALAKMGAASGLQLKVGGSTAHLYAIDPLPPDAPWWDRIFAFHPPIEERVELLAQMGGIVPSALRAAAEAGAKFAHTGALTVVPGPVYREAAPPTDEAEASAEVRRPPVAFCLTDRGATLYERPDIASKQLAQLPSGSLITVVEREEDFLRVITGQDEFGYVLSSAPMTPVEI